MRTRLVLIALLVLAMGAGSGLAVWAAEAPTPNCGNTWCKPGWSHCEYTSGWGCILDPDCAGSNICR